MTIIYTDSLNSLAALKVGILSQEKKLFTDTEQDILTIESGDLLLQEPFKMQTLPFKSSKKQKFSEKVKIWSKNPDTYSDLNYQDMPKNLTIPVQYIQLMSLDFSIQELYETCSGIYNS